MRYAAPAYFTTLNAVADATMTADNPNTAAATCTSVPVWIPATETRPARLPCDELQATMYITDGPGINSKARAARLNKPIDDAVGTASGQTPPAQVGT